jgi:hypothetical protein
MAVTVFLASGQRRVIRDADGARKEGFFLITCSYPTLRRVDTVLTLLSQDVIRAAIEVVGSDKSYVLGEAKEVRTDDPPKA